MNLSQMKNVVETFIERDTSCILIDGTWGVGKTHTLMFDIIDKYPKDKNKVKFAYSSLFGKKSIDDVNIELFYSLHPKFNKAMKIINPIIKLVDVGFSMSGINVGFNSEQIKNFKKIQNKKESIIVAVLDDLERINETNITHKDIMGFINRLITQGIKVIILANTKEINSSDYEQYKEKVVDRIYKINSSEEEIVKQITQKNNQYVDVNILQIIDNNLRILKKSDDLFSQIKKYIEDNKLEFDNFIDLYTICCYCIIEEMTNKHVNFLKESESERYNIANASQLRVIAFEKYIKDIYFPDITNYSSLIYSVTDILESEDYLALIEFLSPKKVEKSPLLEDSIFYLSDDEKKKMIERQYNYVLNADKLTSTEKNYLRNIVKEWYRYYYENINTLIDEDKLFKKLYEFKFVFHKFSDEPELNEFIDRYDSFLKKIRILDIKKIIQSYPTKEFNYDKFKTYLLSNSSNDITEVIIDELKRNSFLISKIHGSMKSKDWGLTHDVCGFFSNKDGKYKKLLYDYLISYKKKYPSDNSLKERIDFLISYFNLKEDDKK